MYGRKQAQVLKPSESSERELSSIKNLIKPKFMDKLENVIEEEQNIINRTKSSIRNKKLGTILQILKLSQVLETLLKMMRSQWIWSMMRKNN